MRKTTGARRSVVLLAAVTMMVTAACGTSDSKSATTSDAPVAGAVDVALSDFMIMPHVLEAKAGDVNFAVHNDGKTAHNFYIRDAGNKNIAKTKTLDPGDRVNLAANLPAGSYTFYCEVPGHESLGMTGTLTVS